MTTENALKTIAKPDCQIGELHEAAKVIAGKYRAARDTIKVRRHFLEVLRNMGRKP